MLSCITYNIIDIVHYYVDIRNNRNTLSLHEDIIHVMLKVSFTRGNFGQVAEYIAYMFVNLLRYADDIFWLRESRVIETYNIAFFITTFLNRTN